MNTVMTDKQFALHQAIQLYMIQYEKGNFGVGPLYHKVQGNATPDMSQVEGVLKLADIFEKQLNK